MAVVVVGSALSTAACSGPAPASAPQTSPAASASTSAADEQAIRTLEDQFAAAVKAGNVDAIMSAYVPDESLHVFDLTPPRQYVGAAAYRKDWQEMLGTFPAGLSDFSISDLAITVGDSSLAASHSIQHMAAVDKSGNKVDMTVRVSDVYRKINGKWLIADEHVSVPVDLATGKPDMSSKP